MLKLADKVPNAERGEVGITLGGQVHIMRPTFDALIECEQVTGQKIIPLFNAFRRDEWGMTDLVGVVTAGIRAGVNEAEAKGVTPKKVGELIVKTGIANPLVLNAVLDFLALALHGGTKKDDVEGEAKAADQT